MDVFVSGVPLEMDDNVIIDKLRRKYSITFGAFIRATCYGHENVRTGERIFKIPIPQLKQVPTAFYLLGWLLKTWYKGCENDKPCPRCKNVGHIVRNCKEEYRPRQPTYADIIMGKPQEPVPNPDQNNEENIGEREINVVSRVRMDSKSQRGLQGR
ncbi:hypothetical protein ACJMK2_043881 [Sinanodonta woodiana]|uniref:CCHC-type domain-containing protein n=1 Tax=Sinanodonta woodiana TaxID=1069815 RepID=A0ABD3VYA9_SINWO